MKNNNSKIINIIKLNAQDKIFKKLTKNITYINTLYIKRLLRFGNYFVSLNKAIIFCEFFSCKRIAIKNDYINHKIIYKKYNLTIEPNNSFNHIFNDSIILKDTFFLFHFNLTNLANINRFYLFRKEILNNLYNLFNKENDIGD